ncbi:MAG: glutaredoxin domain-containing protein [Methanocellales archaeon]|nr:glutaredoxin domain-containing protein [Methanocellales archaeon]MDD3420738.1 glutaredoxin domain-containing protein [Methanocellales archaeon]MDD4898097.1 glutaredoxin domain-containing protein [Methanocellales archaeon]MDD5447222.1 glutaredoxin domain-containing protein [Methanocellales archaeon]
MISEVKVYTTKTCPRCEQLKSLLKSHSIEYEEVDMTTPEALTELRMRDVFTISAPVLQIDKSFITSKDLFDENGVRPDKVLDMLRLGR